MAVGLACCTRQEEVREGYEDLRYKQTRVVSRETGSADQDWHLANRGVRFLESGINTQVLSGRDGLVIMV